MATIIVNPAASSNGSGSLIDPKNTWDGIPWTAGDTYLQIAGTTFFGTDGTNAINVTTGGSSNNVRVTIGVCEAQTGERITDGSLRATIDANAATRGINMGNLISYVTVDGLEVRNAALRGIQKSTVANSPSTNASVIVKHCAVHDVGDGATESYAIAMYGADSVVSQNVIYDCGRVGIFGTADRLHINANHVDRIGLEQLGDCIQLTGSAGPVIQNNFLRKTNDQKAICIVGTGCVGGMFVGNSCVGPTWVSGGSFPLKGLNVESAGMVVVGNTFDCGAEYVIFGNAIGLRLFGNIIVSRSDSSVAALALVGSNSAAYNNTIIGVARGARGVSVGSDAYTGIDVANNIVRGFVAGMRVGTGVTERYNCFHDNTNDITNLSETPLAVAASDITSNPLLDASYRPMAGSPCIGAGVYIAGVRDFSGRKLKRTPDIGARQYYAPREAVSPARTALAVLRDTPATLRSTRSGVLRVGR